MAEPDGPLAQPLGPRRADVVLAEHLQRGRAGLALDQGDRLQGEDRDGKDDLRVERPVPAERQRRPGHECQERDHQERREHVGRDRPQKKRGARDRDVDRPALVEGGDEAERDADESRDDDRQEPELQRDRRGLGDDRGDGAPADQRVAEVAGDETADIGEELLEEGPVEAGGGADRLDAIGIVGDVAGRPQEDQLDRVAGPVEGERIDAEEDQQERRDPQEKEASEIFQRSGPMGERGGNPDAGGPRIRKTVEAGVRRSPGPRYGRARAG